MSDRHGPQTDPPLDSAQGGPYCSRRPLHRPLVMSIRTRTLPRRYLVASDFDQTLSFNDSGVVLSGLIGAERFESKVAGLSRASFVQQGAELAYLLLHDPEFRQVRQEHLVE